MSEEKVTKEVKATETRGAREVTPPKETPKQTPDRQQSK
jgi:hypothetical protein